MADHNMLYPLFFLVNVCKGKIGPANPLFFACAKRLETSRQIHFMKFAGLVRKSKKRNPPLGYIR
jgi:hypothetical protein